MPIDLSIPREYARRAVTALPGRVAKVVLYGSRARGEARADSDWDIAVFLKGTPTTRDRSILSGIGFDLMLETGAFIQSMHTANSLGYSARLCGMDDKARAMGRSLNEAYDRRIAGDYSSELTMQRSDALLARDEAVAFVVFCRTPSAV